MERQGIGRRTFAAGLAAIFAVGPARALPHGWDESTPFAKWVAGLMRPDTNPSSSCCGKGDLYSIVIDEDAIGDDVSKGEWGSAHILDGSAREFPDGSVRPEIPNGTKFKFPKKIVNPPKDGNPGPSAWAFLGVVGSEDYTTPQPNIIGGIYCVIPLPPGV